MPKPTLFLPVLSKSMANVKYTCPSQSVSQKNSIPYLVTKDNEGEVEGLCKKNRLQRSRTIGTRNINAMKKHRRELAPSTEGINDSKPRGVTRPSKKPEKGKTSRGSATVKPCVSVVIPACNEAEKLRGTIALLKTWKRVQEIIVVANGCKDNTATIAREQGAIVIEYAEILGHDTGRALGAAAACGKYVLFLDADIVWQLQDLIPFIRALDRGADIALNTYPLPNDRYFHHPTAIAKRALNIILHRPSLNAASLTTVPHAMRRSVMHKIGPSVLAIPPLALARATMAGLKIVGAHFVNVRSKNCWISRYRKNYTTQDLILGDHLQAIHYIIRKRGERAGFSDLRRKRHLVDQYATNANKQIADQLLLNSVTQGQENPHPRLVAVIPAKNEERTIGSVVSSVQQLQADSIIVVDNGSRDNTGDLAKSLGAHVIQFRHALGHDVGRSIGTAVSGYPECLLVIDGDFALPAEMLKSFATEVLEKKVDIALNDLSIGLRKSRKSDSVSTMKLFLNIVLRRPDLGAASLTAVPYAVSERALSTILVSDFQVPPKAMVRAIRNGLKVKTASFVDVIHRNRRRPKMHSKKFGSPLAHMIIGDHVEAIALLLEERGKRGGYVQPRRLDLLKTSRTTP